LIKCRAMRLDEDKLLSTAEVATQLGVTRQRVLELITDARLPAIKVGRSYVVRAGDVASLELYRVGRPSKPPVNDTGKKKGGNK
jgi:excisionase family DNA binding protein